MPKTEVEQGIRLLAEAMEIGEADNVLDLNCGYGALGIVAAAIARRGDVKLTTSDIRSVQLVQQNITRNRLINAHIALADEPDEEPDIYDIVLMWHAAHLGKDFCCEMIQKSKRCLKTDGVFYIAIKTKKGAKTIAAFMEQTFGNVTTVEKSKGYRILTSYKDNNSGTSLKDEYEYNITAELLGNSYTFRTKPGIFSRKKLDAGTLSLIDTMELNASDKVLDLGCGYGPIGIVAAHLAPKGQIYMVDTNIRAVRCTRYNVAANKCSNVRVDVSDGFDAVNDIIFDAIYSNPPTHSGRDVIMPFIHGAYEQLKPGGQMSMVVVKPDSFMKALNRIFGNVKIRLQSDQHTVISAQKERGQVGKRRLNNEDKINA